MRRTLSIILCLAIILLSMPGAALANDRAKKEFISNYMHIFEESMLIQNARLADITNNIQKVNVDAELSNSSVTLPDGTSVNNMPANCSLEIINDFPDRQAKVSINGQIMDDEVQGILYMTDDSSIVTRETMGFLANLGITDAALSDVEDLPPYVIQELDMGAEGYSLLEQSINYNLATYDKTEEMIAFMEELLNIVPEDCFCYSGSYAVLDFGASGFTSVVLLNNLKDNSEEIAEKFVAITAQPPDMNDEEFSIMQEDIKAGIIVALDSVQVSDLAGMELPFNVEEFKIYSSYSSTKTSLSLNGDIDGDPYGFNLNSVNKLSAGKFSSSANMELYVNTPEFSADIATQVEGTMKDDKDYVEVAVIGDAVFEDGAVSGEIDINMSIDYACKTGFSMPVLNENNSKVMPIFSASSIAPRVTPDEGNYEGVKVYLDDWQIQFENAQPVIIQDRTMLPLRELGENLGCEVTWQPPDTVILSDGYTDDLVLKIDSNNYMVGNESYTMDTAPKIMNDYTYVPIRLVAEYFGFTVEWDDSTKSVILMSNY